MKKVFSILIVFILFPSPSKASLTLIYWHNKTGIGTDTKNYSNKLMKGRYKGEVLYKNDNDPCIYKQKNIHYKNGKIERGIDKFCYSKEDGMRNPIKRLGISIPWDRRKMQSDFAEPICALEKFQGLKGSFCENAKTPLILNGGFF